MADYLTDIAGRYQSMTGAEFDPTVNRTQAQKDYDQKYKDRTTLDFTDMLSLMVAQFQNQTIDNTADTGDMMNQLVQMTTMQAMTEMTDQMKELTLANILNYAASLVGQTVTVGVYDSNGELQEIVGEVQGTGMYNGQQVIYIDGKGYFLSQILAIGTLPPKETESTDPENPGDGEITHAPNCTNDECAGECIVTREDGTKHAADCTDEECEGECLEVTGSTGSGDGGE